MEVYQEIRQKELQTMHELIAAAFVNRRKKNDKTEKALRYLDLRFASILGTKSTVQQ